MTCGKMQLNLAIKIENFNNLYSEKVQSWFLQSISEYVLGKFALLNNADHGHFRNLPRTSVLYHNFVNRCQTK